MNVRMRMLMRVRMLVGMRMDSAIGMPVLVGVDVRVDVGMQVFVRDLGRHDNSPRLDGYGCCRFSSSAAPLIADVEFYDARQPAASQRVEYDGIGMRNTVPAWNMTEEMFVICNPLIANCT